MQDGNGKAKDRENSKKTNKKLEQERDKKKVSKIRTVLDKSDLNQQNASVPKENSFTLDKKRYVLGYAEKQ